jgi:hypothetical protein
VATKGSTEPSAETAPFAHAHVDFVVPSSVDVGAPIPCSEAVLGKLPEEFDTADAELKKANAATHGEAAGGQPAEADRDQGEGESPGG